MVMGKNVTYITFLIKLKINESTERKKKSFDRNYDKINKRINRGGIR